MQICTRKEFEEVYAAKGNTTPEVLRLYGRFAIPCDCGEEMCLGWQMAHEVAREVQEYILRLEHAWNCGLRSELKSPLS
jgi:hypothetical protein